LGYTVLQDQAWRVIEHKFAVKLPPTVLPKACGMGGIIPENDTARRRLLGDAAVCIRKDFRRNRIMMDIVGLVDQGRIAPEQASALSYR